MQAMESRGGASVANTLRPLDRTEKANNNREHKPGKIKYVNNNKCSLLLFEITIAIVSFLKKDTLQIVSIDTQNFETYLGSQTKVRYTLRAV